MATLCTEKEKSLIRLIYQYKKELSTQIVLLRSIGQHVDIQKEIEYIHQTDIPVFPMGGDDLLALGIPAGPRLGIILKRLEEWWLEEGAVPDKECCIKKASLVKLERPEC
jgi:hypothetical protein